MITHYDHVPTKILAVGKSGQGKTVFYYRYILRGLALKKWSRVFVFDHDGQFSHRNQVTPARTVADLDRAAARGMVVFDPSTMFPGKTEEAFRKFLTFAFERSKDLPGKKLFACDELQKYAPTSYVAPELALVLETGRHHALDVLAVTQGFNRIHNAATAQMTEIVSFKTTSKNALERLAAEVDDAPVDDIRNLNQGQYILCDTDKGRIHFCQMEPGPGWLWTNPVDTAEDE